MCYGKAGASRRNFTGSPVGDACNTQDCPRLPASEVNASPLAQASPPRHCTTLLPHTLAFQVQVGATAMRRSLTWDGLRSPCLCCGLVHRQVGLCAGTAVLYSRLVPGPGSLQEKRAHSIAGGTAYHKPAHMGQQADMLPAQWERVGRGSCRTACLLAWPIIELGGTHPCGHPTESERPIPKWECATNWHSCMS